MAIKLCIGPDGDFWSANGPINPVGNLVKFQVPTIHGKGFKAGIVKEVVANGYLEVRGQDGSIYHIHAEETL